ncbi:MAG TPA: hypothetical protein VK822_13605 [Acetobacteraceae bacterium]|jgi:hypothetical protein|nr:hypothetical protein [Acetobacteraceae bacterium]
MRLGATTALWMGSGFGAAAALAAVVIDIIGADQKGTNAALFLTGRLSFTLFWPAYTGSAMAELFGQTFLPLRRRAREFGLAFASAHLVHLGLVAWLCRIGAAPGASTFVFFGIAVIWTYLLALFSIARLHQTLNPWVWWLLRTVGLNYISYAFAVDFLNRPLQGGARHVVAYLPFAVLSIAGPLLFFAASAQRIWRLRQRSSYRLS